MPCAHAIEPSLSTPSFEMTSRVSRDWETIVFHVACYKLWDAERLALAGRVGEADPGKGPHCSNG